MSQELLTDVANGVATLTLNRPDRLNALSRTLQASLLRVLAEMAGDASVGCIVLTGAGRAFCAGGDVTAMAAGGSELTPEQQADELRAMMESARLLHEMPKPTIAMVNGVAAGAGFSLALACDLRIGGESARLGTAFARVGLSGDFGGTYFLTKLVGPARARELYLTADMLDADRCEALGLLNRVMPDAALSEETMRLARQLAAGPRMAWRYMKRNLNTAEHATLAETLDSEAFGMTRCRESDDHREAAKAFVEKRAPRFTGA